MDDSDIVSFLTLWPVAFVFFRSVFPDFSDELYLIPLLVSLIVIVSVPIYVISELMK